MAKQSYSATLYVAATDIGNRDDNTPRIISAVESADVVFVESYKEGSKFLKHYGIKKEMQEISEHTTLDEVNEILLSMIGKTAVLISDCGAPLIEDPGTSFVAKAYEMGVRIVPLPGASSIVCALMVAPFDTSRFLYAGLLPRNKKERVYELKSLRLLPYPVVILDTPYRFAAVVADIAKAYEGTREIVISFDITTAKEETFYGTVAEASVLYSKSTAKREFVIVLDGSDRKDSHRGGRRRG